MSSDPGFARPSNADVKYILAIFDDNDKFYAPAFGLLYEENGVIKTKSRIDINDNTPTSPYENCVACRENCPLVQGLFLSLFYYKKGYLPDINDNDVEKLSVDFEERLLDCMCAKIYNKNMSYRMSDQIFPRLLGAREDTPLITHFTRFGQLSAKDPYPSLFELAEFTGNVASSLIKGDYSEQSVRMSEARLPIIILSRDAMLITKKRPGLKAYVAPDLTLHRIRNTGDLDSLPPQEGDRLKERTAEYVYAENMSNCLKVEINLGEINLGDGRKTIYVPWRHNQEDDDLTDSDGEKMVNVIGKFFPGILSIEEVRRGINMNWSRGEEVLDTTDIDPNVPVIVTDAASGSGQFNIGGNNISRLYVSETPVKGLMDAVSERTMGASKNFF